MHCRKGHVLLTMITYGSQGWVCIEHLHEQSVAEGLTKGHTASVEHDNLL